jgi:hypothetical protein
MDNRNHAREVLVIEAVDLGDIDALEEDITPCTGCVCTCKSS